jgi:hypothetical protein
MRRANSGKVTSVSDHNMSRSHVTGRLRGVSAEWLDNQELIEIIKSRANEIGVPVDLDAI